MAKYIDAEALKRDLIDNKSFFPAIVAKAIENAPAADVVEVVRCKDCKHWCEPTCQIKVSQYGLYSDDFCSCGEKAGVDND